MSCPCFLLSRSLPSLYTIVVHSLFLSVPLLSYSCSTFWTIFIPFVVVLLRQCSTTHPLSSLTNTNPTYHIPPPPLYAHVHELTRACKLCQHRRRLCPTLSLVLAYLSHFFVHPHFRLSLSPRHHIVYQVPSPIVSAFFLSPLVCTNRQHHHCEYRVVTSPPLRCSWRCH